MITQLQFEEIKDNLKNNLYELFDDFINDIRITILNDTILNDDDIIIIIDNYNYNDDEVSNYMRMSKSDFNDLAYQAFKKILNELVYYAQ